MDYKSAGLSDSEYERINELLEREPNSLETQLIGVMWSEHCSYKSTKRLLKTIRRPQIRAQGQERMPVSSTSAKAGDWPSRSRATTTLGVALFQGAATGSAG